MSTDLKKNVVNAILSEPLLYGNQILVEVDNGIVTLTGTVTNFVEKTLVENSANSVLGVVAVIVNIEVAGFNTRNHDSEIAKAIANTYKGHYEIPNDAITIHVKNGWVTLEGNVEWNYQKQAAKKIVNDFIGVKGIINNIHIKPTSTDEIEKHYIEKALNRLSFIQDNTIVVIVNGNTVTLSGNTSTLYEKDQAERIAWQIPGVVKVNNDIIVMSI